jgi:hypothetical protein
MPVKIRRWVMLCVCAGLIFTAPPLSARPSQPSPLPYDGSSDQAAKLYKVRWGAYWVEIPSTDRLHIVDQHGHVVKEIRAEDVLNVDYPVLERGHAPAMRVLVSTGGVAESSEHTLIFSCEHGVRNLLDFNGEITQIRHLNRGGMANLIADCSVPLEYFTGFSHYGCGNVMLVLGWNGSRYVLMNQRYPWMVRREARTARQELVNAGSSDRYDSVLVGSAINCCADLWTIGTGSQYYHWLRRNMTQTDWKWFLSAQPELRRRMTAVNAMATVTQKRLLVFNYGD